MDHLGAYPKSLVSFCTVLGVLCAGCDGGWGFLGAFAEGGCAGWGCRCWGLVSIEDFGGPVWGSNFGVGVGVYFWQLVLCGHHGQSVL